MLSAKTGATCLCALLCVLSVPGRAQIPLGNATSVLFASPRAGSDILAARDEYTARMSHFDRMLRLKSTERVDEATYFAHMASNTLAWTDTEKRRLEPLLRQLACALRDYQLPLPPSVLLVKTTGEEEVGQGHTRGNAIVIPRHSLEDDDETLLFLLAHELFHVMTRHDAHFRRAAYALIGFALGPEIQLPPLLAPLQITNPDAPRHDSYVSVRVDGASVEVIPVLLSRSAVFDPEIGRRLGRYWSLRLLVVARSAQGAPVPVLRNGAPVLLTINQVSGFFEKVGRNTKYIIHPEEIQAENFAFMVTGEPVAEPRRVEALRRLLSTYQRIAANGMPGRQRPGPRYSSAAP